jgi:DNA-binding NarL/FixJ family response regulator
MTTSATPTPTPTAPVRIMLVDDHPLVRDGLRARLETAPHLLVVAEAATGAAALERSGQGGIDLVLMDINMPGGSGLDATAQLHARWPGIVVLVLSMHDKREYVTQAIALGARGYVLKDAPGKDIVTAIDTVMAGDIYYSAGLVQRVAEGLHFPAEPAGPEHSLTTRERDVMRGIAAGRSNKQIAETLALSVRTVETHRLNMKRKLGIEGQAELIRFAVQQAQA